MHEQRILLIQDRQTAQGLQHTLQHHGYDLLCPATGDAVIDLLRRTPVHLLILETRLPDGSGFDLCRRIRQMGFQQPILMLTAQNSEVDKVLGLEMGADDYVTKPYSLREVLSRIRALLRRAYGEFSLTAHDQFYVGDLLIDRRRGRVLCGGQTLNLTPTELRLLTFFAQHPNQVLSRSQILDAVWGYDSSPETEQIVTVNIRRLREKIEARPGDPALLLTVPGIGYRLAI